MYNGTIHLVSFSKPHAGIFFTERNFFIVCYLNLHVTFSLAHCMTLARELLLRYK